MRPPALNAEFDVNTRPRPPSSAPKSYPPSRRVSGAGGIGYGHGRVPPYCVSSTCGSICGSKISDTLSFVPCSLILFRVFASIQGEIILHTH